MCVCIVVEMGPHLTSGSSAKGLESRVILLVQEPFLYSVRTLSDFQMVANVVIYISANLTGLYHKHLTDLAHRHTFLDTRKFIELDIFTRRQHERQVRQLASHSLDLLFG